MSNNNHLSTFSVDPSLLKREKSFQSDSNLLQTNRKEYPPMPTPNSTLLYQRNALSEASIKPWPTFSSGLELEGLSVSSPHSPQSSKFQVRDDLSVITNDEGYAGDVESKVETKCHSWKSDDSKNKGNVIPIFLEGAALICLIVLAYILRFTEVFQGNERNINNCSNFNELNIQPVRNFFEFDFNFDYIFYPATLALPILIFLLVEFISSFLVEQGKFISYLCKSISVPSSVRRFIRFSGIFLFGYFAISITVDSLKLSTGYLRPNFSGCYRNCSNGIVSCTGTSTERFSFPSFYASESSYTAVFLMVYFYTVLKSNQFRLLRSSLIVAIGLLAILVSIQSIVIERNRWEDVLVGLLIGGSFSFFLTLSALDRFKEKAFVKEETNSIFHRLRFPRLSYTDKSGKAYPDPVPVGNKSKDTIYLNGLDNPTFYEKKKEDLAYW